MSAVADEGRSGSDWYEMTVRLPRSWRSELRAAARANGVSQADLIRIAVRSFLSGRYERER